MTIQTIAKRDTSEKIVMVNFRLPESLVDALRKTAEKESTSMTVIAEQGIRQQLSKLNKKQK